MDGEILPHIDEIEQEKKMVYPGVSERVKAALIDTFLLVGIMVMLWLVFSSFDNVADEVRMVSFAIVFVLYDPLFTSLNGGTIGHMVMNIEVKKRAHQQKNISVVAAIIRYLIKVALGWVSLLVVSATKKRRALHDVLVGSIVLYKKQ